MASNVSESRESPTSLFREFDRVDIVALTMLDGFGPATVRKHVARIWSDRVPIDDGISRVAFGAAREMAERALRTASRIDARCILDCEAGFPQSLRDLRDPPVALWVLGNMSLMVDRPTVSIVGTRRCTMYGERVTREIATGLSRAGAAVVSGMAVGIDAMAHRATLESGGVTVAVLGTGIDIPYPARHRALHRQIRNHGVILSEAGPGTPAMPGCFPKRNRLIAALSAATVVVEAPVKSGSLLTADEAIALGRTVAMVPGPIDSPQSVGSNEYMRDGAHVIASVADALALVGLSKARPADVRLESPNERAIWNSLDTPAANFDVLCTRAGLPARLCFETVTVLELRGLVECALTGEVRRR